MKRNKKNEGQKLAGEENKGWGRKRRERRGRLVSQMAGLFVWAARRGEGLFHLSENSSGLQPGDQPPQSTSVLLENLHAHFIRAHV